MGFWILANLLDGACEDTSTHMVIGHERHLHVENVVDGRILMIAQASQRGGLQDIEELDTNM